MRCALVFYLVMVTIFVVVYSLPELCVFVDHYDETHAYCGRDHIEYTFDFIPAIAQNISFISMREQPLKQLPYNAFRNLSSQRSISEIWLRYCQISHVDAGALLNLHNLTAIDLSDNQINHIDSKLFSHTKQIKLIFMANNEIEVLPSGLFQNLLLLEDVNLNINRIRQVERFSFNNTPSLREINLGYNQLESMNMLFKDKFDNLTYLLLYDNPWKCNCELGPLYELVVQINQVNQYGLGCEEPPTLYGTLWRDISRDDLVCGSEDATSTQDSVMTSTEPATTTVLVEDTNSSENSDLVTVESDAETEQSTTAEACTTMIIESAKTTPADPVDNDVATAAVKSLNNHEGCDTNVQQVYDDSKWLPWTLVSVVMASLLGYAVRYTFTRHRKTRKLSVSV